MNNINRSKGFSQCYCVNIFLALLQSSYLGDVHMLARPEIPRPRGLAGGPSPAPEISRGLAGQPPSGDLAGGASPLPGIWRPEGPPGKRPRQSKMDFALNTDLRTDLGQIYQYNSE